MGQEDARTLKFQGITLADPDECFNAVRELAIQTNQVDELSKVLVTMLLIQKPSTWSKYVKLAVATVLGDKNADDASQHSGFDFKSYLEKVRASELPIIEFTDLHKLIHKWGIEDLQAERAQANIEMELRTELSAKENRILQMEIRNNELRAKVESLESEMKDKTESLSLQLRK